MKHLFTTLLAFVITVTAFAQAPATVGQTIIEFNGQKYPCFVTEFNLASDLTEKVIEEKMKSKGYKAEEKKGFLVYRGVKLPELQASELQDVFFKVDKKSRTEKDKSLVYMIATKPAVIADEKAKEASKLAVNIDLSTGGGDFLNSFASDVAAKAYLIAIADQEIIVKKAEKKLKDLQDDQGRLEKKLQDLQSDVEVNKVDQQKQQEEIEKQKALLEEKRNKKP